MKPDLLPIERTLPIIVATTVLHNIARIMGEDEPEEDTELSQLIAVRRQQGMATDFDEVDVTPPPTNVTTATSMRYHRTLHFQPELTSYK